MRDLAAELGRILVVEDEGVVAADIRKCLEDAGFEVSGIAASAAGAMTEAARIRPDLVLMDIRLHGTVDGIDAAGLLHDRYNVPIVYLTAHGDPDTLARAKQAGPLAFLLKPFRPQELVRAIEIALSRARAELREQEQWLALAMGSIGDAVLFTDARHRIRFLNPAAELLAGCPREQALGRPITEILQATDETGRAFLARLADSSPSDATTVGDSASCEFRIKRPQGAFRWVVARTPSNRSLEGSSQSVLVLQDITGRKQTEDQLRLLACIVESSDDAIISKDKDGVVLSWNNGAERLYGYSAQEMVGQSFSRLVPPGLLNEFPRIMNAIERGELIDHYETERVRKDGRRISVSLTVSPLRDEEGRIRGASAIARDITGRKTANEALRHSALYNRALIEASPDPLVMIAADGTITDVNHATERATGCSRAELIGADFCDYFTDPEKAREGYRRVFRDGLVEDYELSIQNRGGKAIPVMYSATVYRDESGNVAGVFAAVRDITQRKHAEQAVQAERQRLYNAMEALARQRADLERSNSELQQFAYVASHDLQEPLRAVASFTKLLADRYRGRLDRDADDFIDFAVDGAKRAQNLINDLLEYSRVNTRGAPFAPVPCESVFEQVMADLSALRRENQATITHDPLPVVDADEIQLGQLFRNLISNALKFHGPEPPRVHVSAAQLPGYWQFSVRDNGIGIDPQFAEVIFAVFQRLHTSAEYPGTGIGLAIAKKIVERHKGRIWVESAPGQGATFYFTIPTDKGGTHV